jgi:hypothetical protein
MLPRRIRLTTSELSSMLSVKVNTKAVKQSVTALNVTSLLHSEMVA